MNDERPAPGLVLPAVLLVMLALPLVQLGFFAAIASDGCMSEPDRSACESAMMPGVYVAGGAPIPLAALGIAFSWRARRMSSPHPLRPMAYAALGMVIAFAAGIAWVISRTP